MGSVAVGIEIVVAVSDMGWIFTVVPGVFPGLSASGGLLHAVEINAINVIGTRI